MIVSLFSTVTMSSRAVRVTRSTCSVGSTKTRSATRTITPRDEASVAGTMSSKFAPRPGVDFTWTEPPSCSTFSCTMASPMPRPETSVTIGLVETPDSKTSDTSPCSSSDSSCSCERTPLFTATLRSALASMPPPSSLIAMLSLLPSTRVTSMRTAPRTGLPRLARMSGVSMPCPTQLRRMWTIGSFIVSSTWRSISMSPPVTVRSTALPSARARSRIILGNEADSDENGSITSVLTSSSRSPTSGPRERMSFSLLNVSRPMRVARSATKAAFQSMYSSSESVPRRLASASSPSSGGSASHTS